MCFTVLGHRFGPGAVQAFAFVFGIPGFVDVCGDFEGAVFPTQSSASQRNLVVTQGRAVAFFFAFFVG